MHEIGHALGLLFSTKNSIAKVYLGSGYWDDSNKESFRIGRIHFHIRWGFVGFCFYIKESGEMTKRQVIIFCLCGPLMSLILSLFFIILLFLYHPQGVLDYIITGMAMFSFVQFMMTIIPIEYPAWMNGYGGTPSDGHQIVGALKDNN